MFINIIRGILIFLFIFSFLYFNVNPKINTLYKHEQNDYIFDNMIPYIFVTKKSFETKKFYDFEYPIVLKPSKCEGLSNDVKVAESPEQAIKHFNDIGDKNIIIQKYSKLPLEGTIIFDRNPMTNNIHIEVTSRFMENPKKEKYPIYKFGGINTKQTKYNITPKLRENIIKMSNKIPDFNFGRYDIKYESKKKLENGEFEVIEINNVFCADTRFNFAYDSSLIYVLYSVFLRLFYGYLNILLGKRISFYEYTKILIYDIDKVFTCNILRDGLRFCSDLNKISV